MLPFGPAVIARTTFGSVIALAYPCRCSLNLPSSTLRETSAASTKSRSTWSSAVAALRLGPAAVAKRHIISRALKPVLGLSWARPCLANGLRLGEKSSAVEARDLRFATGFRDDSRGPWDR
jgi:hypothetical protein